MKGRVFDVEEFAVFDGPGVRCCVFLKGCPLRCSWCHNPEGLARHPQRLIARALCTDCGACRAACQSPDACVACGRCAAVCPRGCVSIVGEEVEAAQLAQRVEAIAPLLRMNGGGITFSGGEPLLQTDFLLDVRAQLPGLHACIETSGFAPEEDFRRAAQAMDLVILDIKHADPVAHRRYTGVDNAPILRNLYWLKGSGIPYRVRVPLIPGVNDSAENMAATAALLDTSPALEKVELLPYNAAAGAKYAGLGMVYRPDFNPAAAPRVDIAPFTRRALEVDIL